MTTFFYYSAFLEADHSLLQSYLVAVARSSGLAQPGNLLRNISAANNQTFHDLGFEVAGKHSPDYITIGVDVYDGADLWVTETHLQTNMVLSFHLGTFMPQCRGLLISNNFPITSKGGVRLLAPTADRYFVRPSN